MGRVAIGAADVIAPVVSPAEVVALFFAGVARKTGFGDLFRRLVGKTDYLGLVAAAIDVGFTRTVTRFTTSDFVFLAADVRERSVSCMRVGLELIFVTGLAGVAADIFR